MALLAIVALGAALRFTGLGQSFWGDEVFTVHVLGGGGFWGLAHRVGETEAAPPLYYWIAWAWARVFGDGEAGLRSLSALIGTATIPVVYLAVRELASKRAGLIAAALCACSPLLVWYSQEARPYALYVFLVALSFWLFARPLSDPRAMALAGWAVAAALAVFSFYLAAIPVLIEAAVMLWMIPDSRRRVLLATALPVATALALLPTALDHRHLQGWIPGIPFGGRIVQTGELFLVGNGDPAAIVVYACALAVLVAGAALALRGENHDRRAAAIAAGIGLIGLAIAIAGKAIGADYAIARNLLFAWVPLAAAVAIALASQRLRRAGVVLAVGLCAVSAWLAIDVKRDDHLQRVDWRAAAHLIEAHRSPGRGAILAPGTFLPLALPQYMPAAIGPLLAPPRATDLYVLHHAPGDGEGNGLHTAGHCWWGAACAMPTAGPPATAPPGFRPVGHESSGLFTLSRFHSDRPRIPRVQIGTDAQWFVFDTP